MLAIWPPEVNFIIFCGCKNSKISGQFFSKNSDYLPNKVEMCKWVFKDEVLLTFKMAAIIYCMCKNSKPKVRNYSNFPIHIPHERRCAGDFLAPVGETKGAMDSTSGFFWPLLLPITL